MVSNIIFPSIIRAFIIDILLILPHAVCVTVILAIVIEVPIIQLVFVLYIETQTENIDESSHVIQGINQKSRDIHIISYS